MNEQKPYTHLTMRIVLNVLLCMSALVLPVWYVVVLGVLMILGLAMYEAVFAGLLFDAVHTALFTHVSLGEFPVTALLLVCVTVGLIARLTIFRLHEHRLHV